jgi:cytochrome c556
MQLLEWALREHLSPSTNSEASFREGQEDIVRYAELAAALGQILQQEGMSNADDSTYNQFAAALVQAARDTAKAAKNNDPELARIAVGQIDQACNKCHAAYR